MKWTDIEYRENEILNEKPYNWVKHFLFDLPELFYFVLKMIILFAIVWAFTSSIISQMIETLPQLCKLLK